MTELAISTNSPVTRSDIATYNSSSTRSSSSSLDSDTFYKLLAAQLQNQDPLEPVDNSQMILQMAQMSTIEQLNNLNSSFAYFMDLVSMQSGSNMVGKEVTVSTTDEEGNATTLTGIVSKVGFTSSGPILQIDGKYYEMWSVITVSEPTTGGVEPDKDSVGEVEGSDSTETVNPDKDSVVGDVEETIEPGEANGLPDNSDLNPDDTTTDEVVDL